MISLNPMRNWYRGFHGRWLTVAVLLIVLAMAGIQLANPHSYVSEAVARSAKRGSVPMRASPT